MRAFLALAFCVMLPGCIDADLTLDFHDSERMTAVADIRMSRQMFDLVNDDPATFCKDSVVTLTETLVQCRLGVAETIDTFI